MFIIIIITIVVVVVFFLGPEGIVLTHGKVFYNINIVNYNNNFLLFLLRQQKNRWN